MTNETTEIKSECGGIPSGVSHPSPLITRSIKPSPSLDYELTLWNRGFLAVAGIDEAGRGAWAGPVSAGAVILPVDPDILDTLHGV